MSDEHLHKEVHPHAKAHTDTHVHISTRSWNLFHVYNFDQILGFKNVYLFTFSYNFPNLVPVGALINVFQHMKSLLPLCTTSIHAITENSFCVVYIVW